MNNWIEDFLPGGKANESMIYQVKSAITNSASKIDGLNCKIRDAIIPSVGKELEIKKTPNTISLYFQWHSF